MTFVPNPNPDYLTECECCCPCSIEARVQFLDYFGDPENPTACQPGTVSVEVPAYCPDLCTDRALITAYTDDQEIPEPRPHYRDGSAEECEYFVVQASPTGVCEGATYQFESMMITALCGGVQVEQTMSMSLVGMLLWPNCGGDTCQIQIDLVYVRKAGCCIDATGVVIMTNIDSAPPFVDCVPSGCDPALMQRVWDLCVPSVVLPFDGTCDAIYESCYFRIWDFWGGPNGCTIGTIFFEGEWDTSCIGCTFHVRMRYALGGMRATACVVKSGSDIQISVGIRPLFATSQWFEVTGGSCDLSQLLPMVPETWQCGPGMSVWGVPDIPDWLFCQPTELPCRPALPPTYWAWSGLKTITSAEHQLPAGFSMCDAMHWLAANPQIVEPSPYASPPCTGTFLVGFYF